MSGSTPHTPNPTTPALDTDHEWFTAYAVIHMLSVPSRRITYFLWIVIASLVLSYAVAHALWPRNSVLSAYWHKFSLRRRTWRKQHSLAIAKKQGKPHKQPIPLPSNAQLLVLSIIILSTLCLMLIGPDYVAPDKSTWSFSYRRALETRAHPPSLSAFYALQPQYTIHKSWWTTGNRAGLVAFALFPLCVLFALKAPPFALFANSWTLNLHFDKLAWLHRWLGRLIWLVVAVHTSLWSVQLFKDKRAGTGRVAYVYAWEYSKFIYAWTAFGFFTALILLSLRPIRDKFYDLFYALHVVLVILTLVFSALHHPPVWWWIWATLMLWAAERLWRAAFWFYNNGFVGSAVAKSEGVSSVPDKLPSDMGEALTPMLSSDKSDYAHSFSTVSQTPLLKPSSNDTYVPPTGFACIELLAGSTMRVTLATPGSMTWAPGQHFLIGIPAISRFVTHPFTCASICDKQSPGPGGHTLVFCIRAKSGWTRTLWDTVVELQSNGVKYPAQERHLPHVLPPTGVLMRAVVDGPFGSCRSMDWGVHSTAIIIAGGSGVSFALSVLEYTVLCMAGRNGRFLGGTVRRSGTSPFKTDRVRFIWIVREFSHLQWGARVLRRCQKLLSPEHIQIDIFVTSVAQRPDVPRDPVPKKGYSLVDGVSPPVPDFTSESIDPYKQRRQRPVSTDSDFLSMIEDTPEGYVDISYSKDGVIDTDVDGLGHEANVLDYTNYNGDDDTRLPGEKDISKSIRREGRIRREKSRRRAKNFSEGVDDDTPKKQRASYPPSRRNRESRQSSSFPSNVRFDGNPMLIEDETAHAKRSPSATPMPSRDTSPHGSHTRHSTASEITDNVESTPPKERPMSVISMLTRASTIRALLPSVGKGADGKSVALEVSEDELNDMRAISEYAHPGRPLLDVILEDEIRFAHGSIVVGCCGPTTLNAIARKAVAAHIDPSRVRNGDATGSISLVVEDFEY